MTALHANQDEEPNNKKLKSGWTVYISVVGQLSSCQNKISL
jgi:hypothetical protein